MEPFAYLQPDRARIRLTGADRAAFLHNMTTNDIKGLAPGAACQAVVVNQRAGILDWVTVEAGADEHWVTGSPGKAAELMAWLDRYLITEDVQLEDHTGEMPVWTLSDGRFALGAKPEGAREVTADEFEAWRLAEGLPCVGKDLTDARNPWEGRLDGSVSLAKGCYLGQEIVARLNAYDKVQRYLVGLRGAIAEGEKLFDADREVGYVSSVHGEIGLGFAKAAHAAAGTRLTTASGQVVTVEDRPFWAGKTRAVTFAT
ncbi:MAG: folate-binding protein YgfZ [Cyanobacteria bacterium RYN_339]|nr:folate-binding protein YgfZ [Cyanobacteria bacterium RYN_339]